MTKAELVDFIAEKADLTKADAGRALEAMMEGVTNGLKETGKVTLVGFGTFTIHDTDGHNPHAHILLTVRPLDERGKWQYKTEKEYLCMKNGEERGFTAAEFKAAQTDG